MSQWTSVLARSASGAALLVLTVVTIPGWLSYAFLPSSRQDKMLELLAYLVKWGQSLQR
jgi:hypothetical protein